VIRGLTDEQVDVSSLKSVEGANPLAFIIINRKNSSRTILYTKNRVPVFGRADVDASAIRDSRVLLIDFYHEEASLAASEIAREAGIPVVVDAESVKPLSTKIMANATHLIASKSFARRFAGLPEGGDMSSAAERIAGLTGCPFVCVTLGEQGAVALERHSGRTYRQRAYRVEVVDTTGAGDVFHGAFAYFLASRRPVEEILRLSSACAALACTRMGGRKGAPTMSELTDFLTRM
jgi:sulfofructose kinase